MSHSPNIPDVLGLAEAEALQALHEAGLRTVTHVASTPPPATGERRVVRVRLAEPGAVELLVAATLTGPAAGGR